MALETLQEIQLFRALEVPYATSYNILDDMGTLSASMNVSTDSSAKTQIIAWVTANVTGDLEDELKRLIGLHADAEFKVGKIEDGSVGDLGNVTFSWDDKRFQYRKAIIGLVPFFRYHETLKSQASGVCSVPFVR